MPIAQPFTVLIIEDDPRLLKVADELLSRAGYTIKSAPNGWDGLKRLKETIVDLVVAELHLVTADGSNLREKSLLNPGMRDVPFLYLVPTGTAERDVRGMRAGVDACLPKPFDPVLLVARVQGVVERRRMYEEITRHDPLTRLLNRSSFEKAVASELERVRRYGRFASMVLLDLDRFSQVNADQGQAMGDLLLTALAGIVVTQMRNIDIAGRYHGEKFMLFLPETKDQGAAVVGHRIRDEMQRVADLMTGIDVTFSAGVVETPRDSVDLVRLCRRAEEAVVFAKRQGAGSVVIWAEAVGAGTISDTPLAPKTPRP